MLYLKLLRKYHLIKFFLVIGLVQAMNAENEEPKPEWNYHEIQGWKEHFSACGGAHQSPININTYKSRGVPYSNLIFGNYHKLFDELVTNNGHTAQFTLNGDADLPFITGGGLNDQFIFVQMHFHWGLDSSRGSEHTIDGQAFPAELHMVHYNSKYGSFNDSLLHQDGLAVLGILLELDSEDNPVFDHLEGFEGIENPEEENKVHLPFSVPLKNLLPCDTGSFYRYNGSLTTPGCNEDVIWTVFDTPVPISESQLEKFRELRDEEGDVLEDNFRPVQELHDRVVTHREIHTTTTTYRPTPRPNIYTHVRTKYG